MCKKDDEVPSRVPLHARKHQGTFNSHGEYVNGTLWDSIHIRKLNWMPSGCKKHVNAALFTFFVPCPSGSLCLPLQEKITLYDVTFLLCVCVFVCVQECLIDEDCEEDSYCLYNISSSKCVSCKSTNMVRHFCTSHWHHGVLMALCVEVLPLRPFSHDILPRVCRSVRRTRSAVENSCVCGVCARRTKPEEIQGRSVSTRATAVPCTAAPYTKVPQGSHTGFSNSLCFCSRPEVCQITYLTGHVKKGKEKEWSQRGREG